MLSELLGDGLGDWDRPAIRAGLRRSERHLAADLDADLGNLDPTAKRIHAASPETEQLPGAKAAVATEHD